MEQTAIKRPEHLTLDPQACLEHKLSLTVRPELAIIGRIALVFSRRGLSVREFNYCESMPPSNSFSPQVQLGRVDICFQGTYVQLDSVTRDLTKILNVIKVEK